VVNFCKQLDDFKKVNENDQIVLVRGASVELLLLYITRFYDTKAEIFKVANMEYTMDDLKALGVTDVRIKLLIFDKIIVKFFKFS